MLSNNLAKKEEHLYTENYQTCFKEIKTTKSKKSGHRLNDSLLRQQSWKDDTAGKGAAAKPDHPPLISRTNLVGEN